MMRGLLNGFPKRKVPRHREYQSGCGPKVPCINQPYRAEPFPQLADRANSGADYNAPNIGLSESGNVPELVNSSELQRLVNNCVKLELNDSLEVLVGKVVTANLKANGVDLSSILVQKVLGTIAQESSKQLLGVANNQTGAYESKNISEIGSTSNEIMLSDVAKQAFLPKGLVDNNSKAIMDIDSTGEVKIPDNFTINIPALSSLETKFPKKRRVSVNREYPPFCGRNVPCPTEEERSRLISGKKRRGEEVIGSSAREIPKKLEELGRGKEVIGASAREMLQKTKKLEEMGRPLKETSRNDSRNNPVRAIASTDKEKNLVARAKPLDSIKGSQNINMRDKVRDTLALFRAIRDELLQKEKDLRRVDLKVAKMIKEKGKEVNTERQWLGSVPGVEVGDEFHYRAELMIIGLHRHLQGGIDYMKNGSVIVATSIIASGGYSDYMANADVLIYSGQGGNLTGRNNEPPKDQEMEKGNLALKNCITTRTKVRVTRGFETKASNMRARITYTYDGLYTVEKFWSERGKHGKLVFKFELRRVPGQPRIAWKGGEVNFRSGTS